MARSVSTADRISAALEQHGASPFRADDFYYVIEKTSQDPQRLVLIGGQAIEVWGVVLKVPPPVATSRGDTGPFHALTSDADWLGSSEDAKWLATLLGVGITALKIPGINDNSPSTAMLYLQREENHVVLMDFLMAVTGLDNKDVEARATELDIPTATGGTFKLRVLDPIHCLVSRMANLKAYASKRDTNGIDQTHWALSIVHAYLCAIIQNGVKPEQVASQVRRILELAEFGPAEYCYTHFQIDPLQCVSPQVLAFAGELFASKEWTIKLAGIEKKRQKWQRSQARVQAIRERRANQ